MFSDVIILHLVHRLDVESQRLSVPPLEHTGAELAGNVRICISLQILLVRMLPVVSHGAFTDESFLTKSTLVFQERVLNFTMHKSGFFCC